jgi:hypothetical protein
MKEVELTKTSIYIDHLKKSSLIKNRDIKRHILSQLKYNPYIFSNLNYHKDIRVTLHQHMCWVMDHMADYFGVKYKKTLVPMGSPFAVFHDQHEGTVLRNHINPYDLYNSPDYTYIYVVQSGPLDDHIIFEYDNHIRKNEIWKVPLETGKFIMWNSSLNYYITPNKNYKSRIIMLVNCQIK